MGSQGRPCPTRAGEEVRCSGFLSTPSTKLGRWSVALLATFAAFFIINSMVFTPWIVEELSTERGEG